MESFIYSLNATLPLFLLIALGYCLQRMSSIKREFAAMCDKFIFSVTLPVTLFMNMYQVDLRAAGLNLSFTLYCFATTLISILGIWLYAKFYLKNLTGEFTQVGYRSSVAILSAAIIENIYGTPRLVPFMVIGSVPLYNFFAILILLLESPAAESLDKRGKIFEAFIKILTNPIIDGLVLGGLFSYLKINLPLALLNTLRQISRITNPLSLIAIGIGFQGLRALNLNLFKLSAKASLIKLVILPLLFVPCAYALGFRGEELLSVLVMFGGPTTFGCYIMARNMGHEGLLTSSVIVLTTLISPVTLTLEIFGLKYFGLI
ncbi:MAG: AEC family transporter [Synergistaceae bacterium]|nr:AEC family transporter [Synergistaceae bacterium]